MLKLCFKIFKSQALVKQLLECRNNGKQERNFRRKDTVVKKPKIFNNILK